MSTFKQDGEPGRVHRVDEVKIGLSRRDFRSLLLVRRRLQRIWEETRFATPTEIGGLFDVMNQALGPDTEALKRLVSRETEEMVTYGATEDDYTYPDLEAES